MMLRGRLRLITTGAILCLIASFIFSPSVFAVEPHQNPELAKPVFSGISLFRYYSGALDFVLRKDPAEVQARLEKMPFANIPESLEQATEKFVGASVNLSHLVVTIDEDLGRLRALMEQFRLDEAFELADETTARLSQADSELTRVQQATVTSGAELKALSAPAGSDLRRSYNEVLERIEKIRGMLGFYNDLLVDLLKAEEPLNVTDITLEVQPRAAFMGDSVHFYGVLTSEKAPLAGREVDILVNSNRYLTVKTDGKGQYRGTLRIPYWYIAELDVQALYYPQDADRGVYLAALSPVIRVTALFYESTLEVTLDDKAYPGLETTLVGRFDYGPYPPRSRRKVEIYLDDVLIAEGIAQGIFGQTIPIDPEADLGEHTVTVSSAATGRYSSAVTSAILHITRAGPILDLSMPKVVIVPGGFDLGGRLYSDIGTLSEASVEMGLGESQVELVSSKDGTFDTRIKVGFGFGVVGSQDLAIRVVPEEPWHAPLNTTVSVLMVNAVNGGGFLAILAVLGVYLPAWLRRRLGAYPRRRVRPAAIRISPEPAPAVYSESVLLPDSKEEYGPDSREPRNRIYYHYRLIVRLILSVTRAMIKPQETLREFATESSRLLGPAARYFIELTRMVERLLYSRYRPSEEDVEHSQRLSHSIEEGIKT